MLNSIPKKTSYKPARSGVLPQTIPQKVQKFITKRGDSQFGSLMQNGVSMHHPEHWSQGKHNSQYLPHNYFRSMTSCSILDAWRPQPFLGPHLHVCNFCPPKLHGQIRGALVHLWVTRAQLPAGTQRHAKVLLTEDLPAVSDGYGSKSSHQGTTGFPWFVPFTRVPSWESILEPFWVAIFEPFWVAIFEP